MLRQREPVHIPPRWLILSPDAHAPEGVLPIRLLEGPGFGDGTHPTTELCLQGLTALAPRGRTFRMLDFGSGSGVLSIAAAAHLDALVDAVEIDAAAEQHAALNARANGVSGRIRQVRTLADVHTTADVIVANILRPVLLTFAEQLVFLLAPGGVLVLSGLVSTDVPEVSARYTALLGAGRRPEIYEREEWRALVWRRPPGV